MVTYELLVIIKRTTSEESTTVATKFIKIGRRAWNYHREDTNGVTNKENIVGIGQTRANIPSYPQFDDEYRELLIPLLLSLSLIQLIYM